MKQIGLSNLKRKTKKTYPNDYRCVTYANGLLCNDCFYPMIPEYANGADADQGVAQGTYYLSRATKDQRAYIGKINNIVFTQNADATSCNFQIFGFINGKQCKFFSKIVNNTVTSGSFIPSNTFSFDCLLDRGTNMFLTISGRDAIAWLVGFNACYIDCEPALKNPKVNEE